MVGISIDPGVKHCGFAVFEKSKLIEAGLTCSFSETPHRVLGVIPEIEALFERYEKASIDLVVEKPKVYQSRYQKGDQRDLIDLATVVGAICHASVYYINTVELVEPYEWKGQTPKDITRKRVEKGLSKEELQAIELPKAKSLQHNVFDAIGIGLWAFK